MGKMIDISSRLTNTRPQIAIAPGVVFDIDDSKNTVIRFEESIKGGSLNDIGVIDDMIKMFLGEEANDTIDAFGFSMASYQTIMVAIMSAIQGVDFEVAEARFQDELNA